MTGEAELREIRPHCRPLGEMTGKWGVSRKCKEDGSFDFTGVPPGEYRVGTDRELLNDGTDPHAERVTVEPDATLDVQIVHE